MGDTWVDVEMVGWGVFRVGGRYGKLYVWDDYPDDGEHDGYGVLRNYDGSDLYEIVGEKRDENGIVMAMSLFPFCLPKGR